MMVIGHDHSLVRRPTDATIAEARAFACHKHAGQTRKGSQEPYINHLDAVAHALYCHGHARPAILAAAYLHDTVDKTDTNIGEVGEVFGDKVMELVYWLTDDAKSSSAGAKITAWRLGRAPRNAKLIKLADIIDNACHRRKHQPERLAVFCQEKGAILDQMARHEGTSLSSLLLFRAAAMSLRRPAPNAQQK
jgi:(p)ppGpp synthase/HD superfamily hydrolase